MEGKEERRKERRWGERQARWSAESNPGELNKWSKRKSKDQ